MSSYCFIKKVKSPGWVTRAPGQGATQRLTSGGQQPGPLIVSGQRQPHNDVAESGIQEVTPKSVEFVKAE
jgi:hypothetical protein